MNNDEHPRSLFDPLPTTLLWYDLKILLELSFGFDSRQLNGNSTTFRPSHMQTILCPSSFTQDLPRDFRKNIREIGHNNCLEYFPIRYTLNWIMIQLLFGIVLLAKCSPTSFEALFERHPASQPDIQDQTVMKHLCLSIHLVGLVTLVTQFQTVLPKTIPTTLIQITMSFGRCSLSLTRWMARYRLCARLLPGSLLDNFIRTALTKFN